MLFFGGVTGWAPIGYEWSHFTPINGQATNGWVTRVIFKPLQKCRAHEPLLGGSSQLVSG